VVDLSGRPSATVKLGLDGAKLGDLMGENVGHVIASLAAAARLTVHVDVIRSENTHHAAEAAFKALALALRMACAVVPERAVSGAEGGPSTKGLVEMEELDREGFESAARRVSSLQESGLAGGPGKGGRM
jgi:imidazoleglycerol-phosphate dehydratase